MASEVSFVAQRIQQIRKAKKLSRAELAHRLNTTRLQIWRIETGVTDLSAVDVPFFADALGVSISTLYRGWRRAA